MIRLLRPVCPFALCAVLAVATHSCGRQERDAEAYFERGNAFARG